MPGTTANGPKPDPELSADQVARLADLVHQALHVGDRESENQPLREPPEFEGTSFSRFEDLTAVGVGGFGCVYRAYDPRHARVVALKIPYRKVVVEPESLRRFRTEVEAAARIDHPGIVPLYEVGEEDGRPYLVSAYCDGENLAQWRKKLAAEGRTLDPTAAARIAMAVARAMATAHDQGVIHRDIKPSNVILQPAGAPADVAIDGASYRVRIVDFGLAKLAETSGELTRSDLRIGTPLFMAPEQISRRFGLISEQTDVYGLGATLYTILTGREPFAGRDAVELFAHVVSETPPPLARVRRGIPKGLDAICRRCLEKSAADRYPTMQATAEDLERFLVGRRVRARLLWLRKAFKGAMRRRTLLIAIALGVALTLATTAGKSGYAWVQRIQGERQAESQKAKTLADEKTEAQYIAALPEAFANLEGGNYSEVRRFLHRFEHATYAHNLEWKLLKGAADNSIWAVKAESPVRTTIVTPWAVFCGLEDGRVEIRSCDRGALRQTLRRHRRPVTAIAPPLGGDLATFSEDGRACIWKSTKPDSAPRKEFRAHNGAVAVARNSPDGRRLVTGGGDGKIKVWTTESFEPVGELNAHSRAVGDASFSRDGKFLVSCGDDGRQVVWDFGRRSLLAELPPPHGSNGHNAARQIMFASDKLPYKIAAYFDQGQVVVYQFDPRQTPTIAAERTFDLRRRPMHAIVQQRRRARFQTLPDGSVEAVPTADLLVSREDGTIAAAPLETADGAVRIIAAGNESPPQSLSGDFEEGRRQMVAADRAGWIRLWDLRRDAQSWTCNDFQEINGLGGKDVIARGKDDASSAGFVGDDHVYVDWSRRDHELHIFDAANGVQHLGLSPLTSFEGTPPRQAGAALRVGSEIWRPWETGWQSFSVVSGNAQQVLRFIPSRRESMFGGPCLAVADESIGRVSLFTANMEIVARLFNVLDGGASESRRGDLQVVNCQVEKHRLAAVRSHDSLQLFRVAPNIERVPLDMTGRPRPSSITDVAFSPGGAYLAAISEEDRSISVWSTATGERHATVYGRALKLSKCAVTRDGKRILALERATGRVNIWDARSGVLLGSFAVGPPGDGAALEFDGRGNRLLVYIRRYDQAFLDGGGDSIRVFNLTKW